MTNVSKVEIQKHWMIPYLSRKFQINFGPFSKLFKPFWKYLKPFPILFSVLKRAKDLSAVLQKVPGGSQQIFQCVPCTEGLRPNSEEMQGVLHKTSSSPAGSCCVPVRTPSIAGVDPGRPRASVARIRTRTTCATCSSPSSLAPFFLSPDSFHHRNPRSRDRKSVV